MSWVYVCPKCSGLLNPDQTLILLGENHGRRMLVGFHPEPGNYEIYFPPNAPLTDGDTWEFFCPICRASLVTTENPNLCSVVMLEGRVSRRVLFSRICGERATYVMYDQQLEHRHGPHSETYVQHLAPIRTTGDVPATAPGDSAGAEVRPPAGEAVGEKADAPTGTDDTPGGGTAGLPGGGTAEKTAGEVRDKDAEG